MGPVAVAVETTVLPAVVDIGGAALRLTAEHPVSMLNDFTCVPAPTKI